MTTHTGRWSAERRVTAGLVAVGLVIVLLTLGIATSGRSSDRLPAGPVAAVQDDHLATVPLEEIPARLDLIAATGATATRVDIFWSLISVGEPRVGTDPADDTYDWRRPDAILTGLAERGITPIVSLYSTPGWAAADPAMGAVDDPFNPVRPAIPRVGPYAQTMAALALRYGGEYVPAGADEPLPEVRRIELWNEPNFARFLAPQVSDGRRTAMRAYARMVRAAYPAIKEANPDAVVIVGAVGPSGSDSDTRTGGLTWLDAMARARVPMDAWSQHIYPSAAPEVVTGVFPSWSSIGRLLNRLDAVAPGLPLYITEAGYTTSPTPVRDTVVTEDEQARHLRTIFALPQLQNNRIPAVVWFNLQDNPNWPAGLLRQDGTAKPSLAAFQALAARQRAEGVALG